MHLEKEDEMYAPSRLVRRAPLGALLTIIAWTLFTGCASGGASYVDQAAQAPEPSTALFVENNSWSRVTVYLAISGQSTRIGDVESMSRRTFSLEKVSTAQNASDLYFIARPLAGQPFRSQSFMYSPGRKTVWTIENQSSLSQLVVR
jgi:hypothetical protein